MKKVPVYLERTIEQDGSAKVNPKVGEGVIYDDGIILIELDSTSIGEDLRRELTGNSISGLSISGEDVKGSTNG